MTKPIYMKDGADIIGVILTDPPKVFTYREKRYSTGFTKPIIKAVTNCDRIAKCVNAARILAKRQGVR